MLPTDLIPDSLVFDGGQPVTLLQKRAGTSCALPIQNATSGPLTYNQVEALGPLGLVGSERNWSLNATDVGPAGVLPGDFLDDGSNRWTILTASLATLGARWRCVARMQV
ncbi:MAG TPA: hypothetical protein VGM05_19745 [Planctomycetaceae bacterium]|jgi:hypothetical protein